MMKLNKSAFTLIELVVTITTVAILATIGFFALSDNSSKAKRVKLESNIKNINKLLESRLSYGDDINDFITGNLIDDNGINSNSSIGSGAYIVSNLKYKVGNINFYKLKVDGNEFKIKTDSGKNNYIFSILKTPKITYHQIAGEFINESGKNEVVIFGKYYNKASSDAKGIISEKGFDIGLQNGDTLTGSLY